ncbi:MAG: hypothetical protein QNJ45_19900 [Ardenticatenaceae bacterium]|nr:hypothetical protein [Ardenticatenaceae bacterium]
MGAIRILSAKDVRQALPMQDAIEGMKKAYQLHATGGVQSPLRGRLTVDKLDAVSLSMPAYAAADDALSIKLVNVFPRNAGFGIPVVNAAVLVLNGRTGQTMALLEGNTLTAIRTGAGAGAATDILALPDAEIVAMLGSGVQARAGLEAVCTIRQIKEVRVFSPNPQNADRFAKEMAGRGPIPDQISVVSSPGEAVRDADIVYAATTSKTPVFDGRDLKRGAHVNGVGSFTPEMQEVDEETIIRSLIIVDAVDSVLEEAGDLIIPMQREWMTEDDIYGELGEIIDGQLEGRIHNDQITFFKSVGIAVQDLVAAQIALKNAAARNLGQVVEFTD